MHKCRSGFSPSIQNRWPKDQSTKLKHQRRINVGRALARQYKIVGLKTNLQNQRHHRKNKRRSGFSPSIQNRWPETNLQNQRHHRENKRRSGFSPSIRNRWPKDQLTKSKASQSAETYGVLYHDNQSELFIV